MKTTPKIGSRSPWGIVDHVRTAAPGIVMVSTPSHGGLWLAPDRCASLALLHPELTHTTGTALPWLEEDCDWALAVLAWPDEFNDEELYDAVSTARAFNPDAAAWLETAARGREVANRAALFAVAHNTLFQRGSLSSTDKSGLWRVQFHRADGASRCLLMPYPSGRWYSEGQLDQIATLYPQPQSKN